MSHNDRTEGGLVRLHPFTLTMLGTLVFLVLPSTVQAKPGTRNLGGGLEQLADSTGQTRSSRSGPSARSAAVIEASVPMIMDKAGRPLVRISLDGSEPIGAVLGNVEAMPGVSVSATDATYRTGVIEAYVSPSTLRRLAGARGVLAVVPASPAVTNAGDVTSQGVVQHRVDQIVGIDGSGITIGVLSDTFDTRVGAITTASDDVASGDLPGPGNPFGRTDDVVVLEDIPAGSDEGRAMLQIIHDMAPGARLGFATAFGGQANFADNIRALAGFEDAPNAVPGFAADVIVDDIIYLAEPFFQDGLIAQAVDEVAATGVAYFSSAGNRPATQAYDSKVRIVTGDPAELSKTPLDFSGVDPALYAGGFHDFDPSGDVDIAQTVRINNGIIVAQWNELFDPQPPTPIRTIAEGTGTVTATAPGTFDFEGTAGTIVEIFVDADDSTTGTPNPDLTFTLVDPNGNSTFVDTGTNPESLTLELPATGTYTVIVAGFLGATGDFLYRVQEVEIVEQVLSDYNLLFFFGGNFLFSANEQNLFSNRPIELLSVNTGGGTFDLELVISRANTPTGKKRDVANRIRYVWFGSGVPQEYFSYLGPVTYGHNSARGAMGVAAYPFFSPYVPEGFTSPGPSVIYFSKSGRRFIVPRIRKKPDLAAMDGANNTFFGGDAAQDDDSFPNFFGTSAAAPHAAAVAALVLDAAGGPGAVKPKKMRKILQRSAFKHDLDPYFSYGVAGNWWNWVVVSARADANAISQFDPNVFTLRNFARRPIANLSLNGNGGNPTQSPPGSVFDERVGPGQPFVIGETRGFDPADVTALLSIPADPPGVDGQWQQLDLSFAPGSFESRDVLSFGIDRDEADSAGPAGAVGGNSADLLGDGVLIPEGTVVRSGLSFFGSFENGRTFEARFRNRIGRGYSRLDGFGFINAERAVELVIDRDDDDDDDDDDDNDD